MPSQKIISPNSAALYVLSGVRRVGKTTIMYQIIDHLIDEGVNPKNIFYATFDNPILKLVDVDSVLSIYESLYPIEGTRYIFFDEIQYTKNVGAYWKSQQCRFLNTARFFN